jgi:hypothetical protein
MVVYILTKHYESADISDTLGSFSALEKAVKSARRRSKRDGDEETPDFVRDGMTRWFTNEYRQAWYEIEKFTIDKEKR